MSETTETERRICRFPGCQRPAAASHAGAGRPPEYCDDDAHNRTSAWHARRRLRTEQSGHAAEAEQRPVDAARQRASELHGQVAGMIEHLGQQMQGLLEELRTVADPEAAELQIEAVTSQAAEEVATATARASRAEQAQWHAEAERAEADAAAEEASSASEQLRTALKGFRQRLSEVEAERDRGVDELADVQVKLTAAEARLVEAHVDRDTATSRAEAAAATQSEVEERARNAVERAEAESARAVRAEAAAESMRRDVAHADQFQAELRNQVSDLRGKLATALAERDAAARDADRAKAYGDQRVDELRVRHGEEVHHLRDELAELRGDLNAARTNAAVQRSRADRAEGRLDAAGMASRTRRRQSYAGRGRRRDEDTGRGPASDVGDSATSRGAG